MSKPNVLMEFTKAAIGLCRRNRDTMYYTALGMYSAYGQMFGTVDTSTTALMITTGTALNEIGRMVACASRPNATRGETIAASIGSIMGSSALFGTICAATGGAIMPGVAAAVGIVAAAATYAAGARPHGIGIKDVARYYRKLWNYDKSSASSAANDMIGPVPSRLQATPPANHNQTLIAGDAMARTPLEQGAAARIVAQKQRPRMHAFTP